MMKTLLSLTPLLLLLFFFFITTLTQGLNPNCDTIQNHHDSSTLQVFHVFSPCSPFKPSKALSWEESVLNLEAKDQARMQYLSSLVVGGGNSKRRRPIVPIASGRQIIQSPTYIVKAKIGTPPQTFLMAMDTSNDAAWLPCKDCLGCSSSNPFLPLKSTTFRNVGCASPQCKQVPNPTCGGSACAFNFTYGTSSVAANLVQDTLSLAADRVPAYTFGCIQKATGTSVPQQGLLGLGRGPLSLLAQTQNLYRSTFSYCLPSFKTLNFSGSLRLGPTTQPQRLKFTPLLKNPRRSSLYYVNLVAIKVGRKIVDIPPAALAFNPTTGAGTIFDSGTAFTRLVELAYIAVRNEFRRQVGRRIPVTTLGGFDTCYSVPIVAPTITLMFSRHECNASTRQPPHPQTVGSITCLAIAAAADNVNSVLNVIANMQQQNHRVLFDVPNSRLGIAREVCT